MFVNKVLESQKLQTVVYKRSNTSPIFVKDPFSKAEVSFVKFKHYPNKLITGEEYKNDLFEKRYRNTPVGMKNIKDQFVADYKVLKPRYLIELKIM